MSKIQDIRSFEERITDVVNEYIQEMDCYDNPVLAIWRRCGRHYVEVKESANLKLPKDSETYPIANCIQTGENETIEPNWDYINKTANEWVFLEH